MLVRGNEITMTGEPDDIAEAERALDELIAVIRTGQGPHARSGGAHGGHAAGANCRAAGRRADGQHPVQPWPHDPGEDAEPEALRRCDRPAYDRLLDRASRTGKTYLAVAKAVQALQDKQVTRIVLTRPAVEAGERLGFLPGTLSEKIDPYLRPLYDALHDMMDPATIPRLMTEGTIEVAPLAYMRGRTLNDAFVILDEAQNTSPEQMKMFLTRLGFGSKMVVTGDVTQIDLPTGTHSGLKIVEGILDGLDDVHFSRLSSHDVVRHRLVSEIVDAYSRFDAEQSAGASAKSWWWTRAGTGTAPRGPSAGLRGTIVTIEVNNETATDLDEKDLSDLCRFVLDRMRIHPQAELAVLLVDPETMAQLHVQWMDEPGPTDVLSFPMDELRPTPQDEDPAPGLLGDVVLCPDVAYEQARHAGHSFQDELRLLTTHGILHLIGYDHGDPVQEKEMFGLQAQLLDDWRVGRKTNR